MRSSYAVLLRSSAHTQKAGTSQLLLPLSMLLLSLRLSTQHAAHP
jgi:hypothetical protein